MKDYKAIWNDLSTTFDDAGFFVCCTGDEDEIRSNGALTAQFLRTVLPIGPTDSVLEIGCGVARIGRELAPYCREWHGADISGNMIEHARQRTADIPNIYLHELPDNSLRIFPDGSFDCVYCTIVFMHLDKPDMFTYMREAYRVLKPGGRAYFDTYNILAPGAWEEFSKILSAFPPGVPRPGHVSQFSTPQEMRKFIDAAGFDANHIDGVHNPQLVVAVGYKWDPDHPDDLTQWRDSWSAADAPGDTDPWMLVERNRPDVRVQQVEALLTRQTLAFQETVLYSRQLEAEITRKNDAIADLERRLRQREQELDAARAPRLPWPRRKAKRR